MRSLWLSLFISFILSSSLIAQNPAPDSAAGTSQVVQPVSVSVYDDSAARARSQEQMNRNLDAFVRQQKEREKKEWQRAWMRIGLGMFFLVVLIVGMLRRRKKK